MPPPLHPPPSHQQAQYPFPVTQSQSSDIPIHSQSPASPLRRPNVQAPTLLTASLNNAHTHTLNRHNHPISNVIHTPVSTTTLSSPFALTQSSPYASSPSMPVRGPVQPFVGSYNPQQWSRVQDGMGESIGMSPSIPRQTIQYAPRLRGPDEPMASPPPPYTADPPSAESTSSAVFSHPPSASTVFTPDSAAVGFDRWSPDSPYTQIASPLVGQVAQFPPPPPSGQRVRSTSRNHAERFLGGLNILPRQTLPAQSAIEPQQHQTTQIFDQFNSIPPTARRALSASAVNTSLTQHHSPLQPNMAQSIPPPPPGPPPTTSRSQSMNRVSDVTYSPHALLPIQNRRPPGRGSALGPVPPTPANWVDEDTELSQSGWPREELSHETPASPPHDPASEATSSTDASNHVRRDSSGLVRSPAVRNRSAKGLRERRSESKIGKRHDSDGSDPCSSATEAFSRPLQDIITNEGETLASRRASTRLTPKSAQFRGLDEALQSASSIPTSARVASGRTTPQSASFSPASERTVPTPVQVRAQDGLHRRIISGQMNTTPTSASQQLLSSPSTNDRPVSHILHLPNNEEVNIPVMPLSPESVTSRTTAREADSNFTNQALERHREFLIREASAQSDSERLHIFVEYMKTEAGIRRERYAEVFEEEELNPAELLEGVFEEPGHAAMDAHLSQLSKAASIETSRPSSSSANSYIASQPNTASRQTSTATSMDHPNLSIDTTIPPDNRRGNFVPCLSPIASMSAVTRDETESRGRAPSRWWESGSNPSANGDGFKVLERSKRETKYMSAVIEHDATSSSNVDGYSLAPIYGEDEYPPEKTGFHDQQHTPGPANVSRSNDPHDAPYTPNSRKLDVSRLITLPPPYPRRHPAVNNSHPDLADIRGIVRVLSDSSEIDLAKNNYKTYINEKRARADSFQEKQRTTYDTQMQHRMDSGTISQSEFDAAEASLESTIATSRLELAKADFSLYESLVVSPLHTIYTTRIARASEALNALSSRLISDTSTHSPNLPQEAGDEQPELLEKLTMLKWLFEARESLHRDLYGLLSARNDRYKATVLLPLSTVDSAPEEKASAEEFFAADSHDRKRQFASAMLVRWESFHGTIKRHVTRGVEIILSAFWDIAPPLQALLHRIPTESRDLRPGKFDIVIPRVEVEENPVYWDHPLRYLWSIVCHAEASTRQFVEGQVSLWCLLQEVREGAVRAKRKSEIANDGQDSGDSSYIEQQSGDDVRTGVEDLKEKVAAIEGQWVEGLGGEITRVKEGIRTFLEATGGWDDELDSAEDI